MPQGNLFVEAVFEFPKFIALSSRCTLVLGLSSLLMGKVIGCVQQGLLGRQSSDSLAVTKSLTPKLSIVHTASIFVSSSLPIIRGPAYT